MAIQSLDCLMQASEAIGLNFNLELLRLPFRSWFVFGKIIPSLVGVVNEQRLAVEPYDAAKIQHFLHYANKWRFFDIYLGG